MNALTLSDVPMQRADLPRLSRNAAIALAVVLLHAGLLWGLQSGLLKQTVELVVPAEVLAEFIEPPAPKVEPVPPTPPAPPAPPVPARVKPAPAVPQKAVTRAPVQPQSQPQPLAIADPTPAPNAPTGALTPAPVAPPAPVTVAPAAPPAPPAPPAVQLPSTNADYLQNPKPAYPALSKRLNEQGKVVLRVLISTEGTAKNAEIRQSSGYDRLDQAALATVLKWRYVPGKRGGVPEEMWFNVPINFVLE